jgi:hypothetical protein
MGAPLNFKVMNKKEDLLLGMAMWIGIFLITIVAFVIIGADGMEKGSIDQAFLGFFVAGAFTLVAIHTITDVIRDYKM